MKKIFLFFGLLIAYISTIAQQIDTIPPPPPPPPPFIENSNNVTNTDDNNPILKNRYSQSNSFGDYFQISNYKIKVPFAGEPHISPTQDNGVVKVTGYQYAYPNPNDDLNFLYGIEICELKNDSMFKSINSKIDFVAKVSKFSYVKILGGELIKEEQGTFHDKYCVKQKVKINIPDAEVVYINSLFIFYSGIVIRIYSFTPLYNDNNKRINDFFESIIYD